MNEILNKTLSHGVNKTSRDKNLWSSKYNVMNINIWRPFFNEPSFILLFLRHISPFSKELTHYGNEELQFY